VSNDPKAQWTRFTVYAHIEIRDADGNLVAVVGSGSEADSPARNALADARLIASAPELLAALEVVVSKARKQNWNDCYPDELAQAVAAIAKSTGDAA
jgi:hypothetical protein